MNTFRPSLEQLEDRAVPDAADQLILDQIAATEAHIEELTAIPHFISAYPVGNTVYVTFSSPTDMSIILITPNSMGNFNAVGGNAAERIYHTSGQEGGVLKMEVPSSAPQGTLLLRLFDEPYGDTQAIVRLNWDGQNLSLADEVDGGYLAREQYLINHVLDDANPPHREPLETRMAEIDAIIADATAGAQEDDEEEEQVEVDAPITHFLAAHTEGNAVYVTYSTPTDDSIILITPNSLGNFNAVGGNAADHPYHTGGQSGAVLHMEVPTSLNHGTYLLRLFDEAYGETKAMMQLGWDGQNLTVLDELPEEQLETAERVLTSALAQTDMPYDDIIAGQLSAVQQRLHPQSANLSLAAVAAEASEEAEFRIRPDLGVLTQGNIVYVTYSIPTDESIILITRDDMSSFNAIGGAAADRFSHTGGKEGGLVQMAIPQDTAPGILLVRLFEEAYGDTQAIVRLEWDGQTATVLGTDVQNVYFESAQPLLDSLSDLRSDIAFVARISLFEDSAWFVGSQQFDELLRGLDPLLFAENPIAVIEQWRDMHMPSYTIGQAEQSYLKARSELRKFYWDYLGDYETGMSQILLAAVDFWIKAKQGQSESEILPVVQAEYDRHTFTGVAPLGLQKPSFQAFMEEGKRLMGEWYDELRTIAADNDAALLADQRAAFIAEIRESILAEQVKVINRALDELSAHDALTAQVIAGMKADDHQLAYHWAQQLVPVGSTQIASAITLQSFLVAQLEGRVVVTEGDVLVAGGLTDGEMQEGLSELGGGGDVEGFFAQKRAEVLAENPGEVLNMLLGLYESQVVVLQANGKEIRVDTASGKIFAGLLGELYQKKDDAESLGTLVSQVEYILGIPAARLFALTTNSTYQRYVDGLVYLFTQYGYDFNKNLGERELDLKIEYVDSTKARVHFAPGATKDFSHARLYFIDPFSGSNIPNAEYLSSDGKLFFDISGELAHSYPVEWIKIVVWWKSEGDTTTSYALNAGVDESRLDKEAVDIDQEKSSIIDQLAARPPVNFSVGTWKIDIGSSAHDDQYGSFHALDINLPGGTDRDKDVLAVMAGYISDIDLTYGRVVIDHQGQGSIPSWQSKYLHMPLYETGEVVTDLGGGQKKVYAFKKEDGSFDELRIWEGMKVNAGEKVGIIAGRGLGTDEIPHVDEAGGQISDSAFGMHLHYEAMVDGESIDIGALGERWGIRVIATDGNKVGRDVVLSSEISLPGMQKAWVNTDEKLIFFRSIDIIEDSQTDYFVAWEEGKSVEDMERVVLKQVGTVLINGSSQPVMRWTKIGSTDWTSGNNVWNPESQSWINV